MNGIFTTRGIKKGLLIPYTGVFKPDLSEDQECPYCMTVKGGAVDSEDLSNDCLHIAGYVNEPDVNQTYNCMFVQTPYKYTMPGYRDFKPYGGLYMFLLVARDIPDGGELLASYGPDYTHQRYKVKKNPPKWGTLLYSLHKCGKIPAESG